MSKNLYSFPHTSFLSFNPGVGKEVEAEISYILSNLYLKTKYTPVHKAHGSNELELSSVSLYSLVELLLRSQTLEDIKLKVAHDDVYFEKSFVKFLDKVNWEQFLPRNVSLHLRVDSVGSRLFHESMLKDMFAEKLAKKIDAKIVSKEEHALTTVYVDIKNNKCTLSLSLAGDSLYKRGFREIGGAVAPLREDLAQTCIRAARKFCKENASDFDPKTLWVPFGGTGTFVFEYFMYENGIAPCVLGRNYALQKLPFFNEKNFQFIVNKADSQVFQQNVPFLYMDHSSELSEVFAKNLANFSRALKRAKLEGTASQENVFSDKARFPAGDIFVPLNPPYGLRMNTKGETPALYARIAKTLLEHKKTNRVGGFVLCPSEEAWSAFVNTLGSDTKVQTFHVTQGGLDLRVCMFVFV